MSPIASRQTVQSTSSVPVQAHTRGLVIELTVLNSGKAIDVSFATKKQIIIKPPSGANIIGNADFSTDGTDGKIKYITTGDDLTTAGNYYLQAYLEGVNFSSYSSTVSFSVVDNL